MRAAHGFQGTKHPFLEGGRGANIEKAEVLEGKLPGKQTNLALAWTELRKAEVDFDPETLYRESRVM